MNATVKAGPNASVIRLENGVTVDLRFTNVEVWAPGAFRLYRGPLSEINVALSTAYEWRPER